MDSASTSKQATDEFAKCVICYLVYDDYLSGRAFLHKFYNVDYSLKDSSIGIFVEGLIKALEESSMDKYNKSVNEYKLNCKAWNNWMDVMIKHIELKIQDSEGNKSNFAEEDDFK